MKTIIIIEDEALELQPLVNLFEQWQREINILTASEEKAAINLMSQHHVDLLICDLHWPADISLKKFSKLAQSHPYVPSIALMPKGTLYREEIIEQGATHCLSKPIDSSELLLFADDVLNDSNFGTVRGLPVHSLLQMLESEGKSCILQVDKKDDKGLLYIKNGSLINAETKSSSGEEAAHSIITWKETIIRIRFFNGRCKSQIAQPLISLIMDAFRLSNEQENNSTGTGGIQKHQLPLKHVTTRGKRIPLDVGNRVELELPNVESAIEGHMVGMVQENCLLFTCPQAPSKLEDLIGEVQRIIIKFINKGRVWMFKTRLLSTVNEPTKMLVFEYPGVIHCHELRKAKRRQIFIPSTFHLEGRTELYGALIDLSMSGGLCQIKHRENFLPQVNIHSDILMRCLLPGIKEEQKIKGKVRNMKIDRKETRLGIEFINLQPHLSDTIGKYLYSIDSLEDSYPD